MDGRRSLALLIAATSLAGCATGKKSDLPEAYVAAMERGHEERIARLTADDGWLTLVGLFWMDDGDHTIGRVGDMAYEGFPVEHVGTFVRLGDVVGFKAAPGVEVEGLPEDGILETDDPGPPSILRVGTCDFYVIERGDLVGVRLRDIESEVRTSFTGIERFPLEGKWRVKAGFIPPKGKGSAIDIESIIGTTTEHEVAGTAQFLDGETPYNMVLLPGDGPGRFFVIFGDMTNGKTTHGGGRYLDAVLEASGITVILDFNRAYNPPCAFTQYATCPIPPVDNILLFEVPAGEKAWGKKAGEKEGGQ